MKIAINIILSLLPFFQVFAERNTCPPIGKLGVQLGTLVDIKGEIVDGESLRCKSCQSIYLIKINEINGSAITNKLYMSFRHAPGAMLSDYPQNHFALYKKKTGREPSLGIAWEIGKAGSTSSEKNKNESTIEELQVGYVGKPVHFLAWEAGIFDGIPKNLPEGTPLWSDGSFGFRSWLVLLDDLTKKNSKRVGPTVKTPVESGKVQGTAGHE